MRTPLPEVPQAERVPLRDTLLYCAPVVAYSFYFNFTILYLVKYSTDVLLISATIVGGIFGVARLWDTISDPLTGYLSDQTRSRFGRRRPWIAVAALPLGLAGIMIYTHPQGLSHTALIVWVGAGMIGLYTALTAIQVPHYAWGAELTPNYHERSRLFGAHALAQYVGMLLAIVGLWVLIGFNQGSLAWQKTSASFLAMVVAAVALVLILSCVFGLREVGQNSAARESLTRAFATLWRNRHARILLIVNFIERTGYSTIGVLTLYVADYVLRLPQFSILIILIYVLAGAAATPLWVWLAGRYGKSVVWFSAMVCTAVGFNLLFLAAFLEQREQLMLFPVLTLFIGAAAGCGTVLSSSVLSDVIDYDELQTGQRREGAYFACWQFSNKVSLSFMVVLIGAVLELSGYIPNEAQPRAVVLTIMGLYCLFPGCAHVIGAWLFWCKFKFNQSDHAQVREELEARRGQRLARDSH